MAIENITPGMQVYAMDTETNTVALKEVVRTFENETNDLIRVTIGEEIYTVTYGHPFYVEDEGFVLSEDLEAGDEVLLLDRPEDFTRLDEIRANRDETDSEISDSNATTQDNFAVSDENTTANADTSQTETASPDENFKTATVISVEAIHVDEPVKVYNFEVEDSHTYICNKNAC